MEKQESLFDLIQQAQQMLLDRSKAEQDLIYYVAKLPDDLRSGIILAYEILHPKKSCLKKAKK